MDTEIPITCHPKLPDGVPLVANFHDDRNRLSYYYPILRELDDVRTPITQFVSIDGSVETCLDIEYRHITEFMQSVGIQNAFVRGDYSSGKFDGESGSKITSHDPYDIEQVVVEMIRQLYLGKRHLGGRLAVREWVPHDREVRFFVRDGGVVYADSMDSGDGFPWKQAELVAERFDTFAWSVDFIRHETSGEWYCIDMGLDGLYHGTGWIAISEHLDPDQSPARFADEMPDPDRFNHRR